MVASELPQEILIDIFSRLPAKSVGQCRCLSKPWRDILSSPQFIKSHLNQKSHQQSLLLIDESRTIYSIATAKDGGVSRELELPFGCPEILGCCDGLVLLASDEGDQFLMNPVTLERVIIPKSPLALKDGEREIITIYGFGYDSSIDDYKIVTLSYYENDDDERDWNETFVDVYFVKRGVWKRIENSPYNLAVIPEPHPGAFLNGAIHWLATSRDSSYMWVLVAFSLFDEVFTEIPAPDDFEMKTCWFFQPVVLGGCLCIIDVRHRSRTNVWMMKEYGLVESWTNLRIHTCGKWGIEKPLCFDGNQEIVLIVAVRVTLGVYNLKEGTLRDLIVEGVPIFPFEDGIAFVPSLVSPANVDKAYYESLSSDVLFEMSAANMDRVLSNHSILVQRLHNYKTTISALEHSVEKSREDKEELESELQKRSRELSALTRDRKKMRGVNRRLSEKLAYERRTGATFLSSGRGKAFMSEMCRQSVEEAYKASTESRVEPGQVNEDVVMLVGPNVAEVVIDKGAGSSGSNIGC